LIEKKPIFPENRKCIGCSTGKIDASLLDKEDLNNAPSSRCFGFGHFASRN
jgi:hypothetical protein